MPQHDDGKRSEPPRSEPTPSGVIPAASAAASPPLEPPGVRVGSHGLRVRPRSALSVSQRRPRSGAFVRARGMAPAARRFATAGASSGGTASAIATTPCVVGDPARSIVSLTVNGTPWNGLVGSSRAIAASASSAADRASSASERRLIGAKLGETVSEGKISVWFKTVGDAVKFIEKAAA